MQSSKLPFNFWLMCASMLLFMVSFNMVLPEMNEFLKKLGGGQYIGLIIGLFTISSAVARPFAGKLADFIGRKKAMYIGVFIAMTISLAYSISSGVIFFLTLRFFHGFAAGFYPTGATALITDEIPENKRGTAMGIWGTFISIGIALGQAISTPIKNASSIEIMFISSALACLLSFLLLISIKESLVNPVRFEWKHLHVRLNDIFEPKVIPVAIIISISAVCSGMVFVLTSDLTQFLKIDNKGAFFILYVSSTIFVRLTTGYYSDRFDRRKILIIGFLILGISMLMLWKTQDAFMFYASSIVFGIATGISSPNIFAWTAELSPDHRRGVGAGTMFIALEFGIFSGTQIANFVYQNDLKTIQLSFFVGFICSMITVFYLVWHILKRTVKAL